jgi:hypothetical protein
LDNNKGEKSSLTLSKTWPRQGTDLGDPQQLMETYVFPNYAGNNRDFLKYNKKSAFDNGNKIIDSIPPILHGLNIKTITNTDVKDFIQQNYELVAGVYIFKPDLQLYSNTFKGFDKANFVASIEQTIIMKSELKLSYRQGQKAVKDELDVLTAELAAAKKAVNVAKDFAKKSKKEQELEEIKIQQDKDAKQAEIDRDRAAIHAEQAKKKAEYDAKWWWQKTGEYVYDSAATAALAALDKTQDAIDVTYRGAKLGYDVVTGDVSIKDAKNRVTNRANYLYVTNLDENQLKYFDTFIGVQFDYFNELEVNVKNPFGLKTFSDFYQKYDYGTDRVYRPYTDDYLYFGPKQKNTINFIASFNEIFSPSIFSKPLANAYYDVETGELLYNSAGIKEL